MSSELLTGLFPPPRSIRVDPFHHLPTPREMNLISQANMDCTESFCRGFSLAHAKGTPQPIIGTKGVPLLLLPASEEMNGYKLRIQTDCVRVEAASPADFQYAGTTLGQFFESHPDTIPEVAISDEPVFAVRGVMLDISRNKVPTMATLHDLVDTWASWKINHLELYTEHTFAYVGHPTIWEGCSPITAEEVRKLDDYCRLLHIELAANQNSFGHLHRWLRNPDYIHLAESPDGYTTPWGEKRTRPFSLNPLRSDSLEFLSGLYDELLPNFSSPLFNVGCDETYDLGQGASREACEKIGKGRVYLDFIKKIKHLVEQREKTMLFWGDIVLNHPELIPELEKDMIPIIWGYEADHPFDEQCRKFKEAGLPFWVCPGTSTWNSIAGRLDNALSNIQSAATAGAGHGASGFLITEWGDNGHWQTRPFSDLAIAAGACAAWSGAVPATSRLKSLFPDADVAFDLANLYRDSGFNVINNSPIFPLIRFVDPSETLQSWTVDNLERTLRHLAQIKSRLALTEKPADTNVNIMVEEMTLAADMLNHALRRGLWLKDGSPAIDAPALAEDIRRILGELKRLWLIRNREGGLNESTEPLEMRLREYQDAAKRHSTFPDQTENTPAPTDH